MIKIEFKGACTNARVRLFSGLTHSLLLLDLSPLLLSAPLWLICLHTFGIKLLAKISY